jgi:hypothetical protein
MFRPVGHPATGARRLAADDAERPRTIVCGQRLRGVPGLPDCDSVEEWLSLEVSARRSRISTGGVKYVIFVGSGCRTAHSLCRCLAADDGGAESDWMVRAGAVCYQHSFAALRARD